MKIKINKQLILENNVAGFVKKYPIYVGAGIGAGLFGGHMLYKKMEHDKAVDDFIINQAKSIEPFSLKVDPEKAAMIEKQMIDTAEQLDGISYHKEYDI